MSKTPPRIEEFQVTGEQLLESVRRIIHEGNIRRISIRNTNGVTLLEIPLVVGLAGAVLVPVWAAVGALAALLADCTLVVERVAEAAPKPPAPPAAGKKSAGGRKNAA